MCQGSYRPPHPPKLITVPRVLSQLHRPEAPIWGVVSAHWQGPLWHSDKLISLEGQTGVRDLTRTTLDLPLLFRGWGQAGLTDQCWKAVWETDMPEVHYECALQRQESSLSVRWALRPEHTCSGSGLYVHLATWNQVQWASGGREMVLLLMFVYFFICTLSKMSHELLHQF